MKQARVRRTEEEMKDGSGKLAGQWQPIKVNTCRGYAEHTTVGEIETKKAGGKSGKTIKGMHLIAIIAWGDWCLRRDERETVGSSVRGDGEEEISAKKQRDDEEHHA